MWQQARFFQDKFYAVGDWVFQYAAKFPHCEILAADTETKLYYKGQLVDDETVYKFYQKHGQAWVKDNIEVRCYAFMLSDGENFVLFQNAEDFLTACAMFNVKRVFWYNTKFDFAIFDYYFLTHGWVEIEQRKEENGQRYRKLQDMTYQSLNGDFGQRYQMRVWKKYINRSGQEKVHNFKMLDVCNIFGGGLAANLRDFDITDKHGQAVRKLEMDYTNASIEADIQYMINDTKGLYLLAEKIDKMIYELTELSLFKGDYMTAGGLAKRTLLKEMFQGSKWENVKQLHRYFPMTIAEDNMYRQLNLYRGGLCLVNPSKRGKVQQGIYKYDVNSMYPAQMRSMLYPVGRPEHVKKEEKGYLYIYHIRELRGYLKEKMCPIWHDTLTGDFVERIIEPDDILIWKEELEELKLWYDISYQVVDKLQFRGLSPKGAVSYVDKFYSIKCKSKGSIKQGAKLFLNSAYGKWAQRAEIARCKYVLSDNGKYVHMIKESTESDEKSLMSVVVGSRITMLARVTLLQYIRDICQGDVSKNFVYCDTDSVHSLVPFADTDPKALGKMKCEGIYGRALYLAPKTYLLYDELSGEEERYKYEVHCKGVNVNVVKKQLEDVKSFEEACDVFAPNRLFRCLAGMNVQGGKALIYVDKMILNDNNLEVVKKLEEGLEDIYEDYV